MTNNIATTLENNMKKYLVVWSGDDGVIVQSEVNTADDPKAMTQQDWMLLAAASEDTELDENDTWDLFLVIDFPAEFHV